MTREWKTLRILGIETSCDETAGALLELKAIHDKRKTHGWYRGLRLLSNVVASQIDLHRKTGGVVPEVAAREHVKAIVPTIRAALQDAARELQITDYELRPDVIAVTNGPGLITSLMVGVETARTLAAAWNIPLVAVNHLEGHILAAFLKNPQSAIRNSTIFPALALLVSGGHTELVLMRKWLDYQVIGETLDDAAGEAFDKVAKILELPYPGGPAIEAAAKRGNASQQPFTPPMLNSGDFNFSFSGIKTAVLYRVRSLSPNAIYPLSEVEGGVKSSTKESLRQAQAICFRYSATGSRELGIKNKELRERNDIAAGFQKAVVEVLVAKTLRAAKQYRARTVILCGGVAANTQLRNSLASAVNSLHSDLRLLTPDLSYCGDNAAMIAAAGALRALAGKFTPWQRVVADPTLALRSSS